MASIKQIVNFQLKVLRMAGFVEFVQQVAKLVKDFRDSGEEGVSQLPTKVEPVYTSFKDSVTAVDDAYKLSRASDYTQKIADEDDRRDNLFRQLVNLLKMYRRFGYYTEKKAAADYLWNIVKKYNVDPVENYSEESSKLQQMLQELHADTQAGQHLTRAYANRQGRPGHSPRRGRPGLPRPHPVAECLGGDDDEPDQ